MKIKRNTGQTLYRRAPEKWDTLAWAGFSSLAAAAQRFYDMASMGKAIGASPASISRWMQGDDKPRHIYEIQASEWLRTRKDQPKVQRHKKPHSDMPLFAQNALKQPPQANEAVLVVRCPKDKLDMTKRILGAMHCTIEATA